MRIYEAGALTMDALERISNGELTPEQACAELDAAGARLNPDTDTEGVSAQDLTTAHYRAAERQDEKSRRALGLP